MTSHRTIVDGEPFPWAGVEEWSAYLEKLKKIRPRDDAVRLAIQSAEFKIAQRRKRKRQAPDFLLNDDSPAD